MSLYKNNITIGGVRCGLVLREAEGYTVLFEREFASLEEIEAISWDRPEISGDCALPDGCGFSVTDIIYSHVERCYRVKLALEKQYLGDVAGYQAQIDALREQLSTSAEHTVSTGELMDAYTEGVNKHE